MTSPFEKGSALETAVRSIEATILHSSPALAENTSSIESKKVFTVAGVRHEVDVYVVVDVAAGYRSVFIFECKNWEEAVGKNEVIVFSEKIDALQAQRGFFVAKSFSQFAEAQAALDPRITLLQATQYSPEETPVPFDFHFIITERTHASVEFRQRGQSTERVYRPLEAKLTRTRFNGTEIDLDAYIREWMAEAADESVRTFPSASLPEGIYEHVIEHSREFDLGSVVLDDIDMESASLKVELSVRVVRPPVVSHFEVATRGRSLSLAPVSIGGTTIQAGWVAT
jgi:hypothetical protein